MRKVPSVPAIAPVTRTPSLVRTATDARAIGEFASPSTTVPRISPCAGGGPPAAGPAGPCACSDAAPAKRTSAESEDRRLLIGKTLLVNVGAVFMAARPGERLYAATTLNIFQSFRRT